MNLETIIGIIAIIFIIALIPGIFFKKEYTNIENKINQVKSEESTLEENLYYIKIELSKIRNLFYIFIITIIIPMIIKIILLSMALMEFNKMISKLNYVL